MKTIARMLKVMVVLVPVNWAVRASLEFRTTRTAAQKVF